MRGADKDNIILNILKEGVKTRRELCIEAINRGISESTAYRRIDKLINLRCIKEGKCELVQQIKEANRQKLDECLKTLNDDDNENVIYSRLKQLTKMAYDTRIAHSPNVIQTLTNLLEKEKITRNERNFDQFFECLNAILFFEQHHQPANWEKINETLITATIEKSAEFVLKKPHSRIIEYLGKTNRKDAVNVIFQMMKKHPIEAEQNEYCNVVTAFGKDRLYNDHSKLINHSLDNFLRSKDNRLIKLATKLRERID